MGPLRPYRPFRELENIWRLRLEEAADRHKAASVGFQKILDEIVGGGTFHPMVRWLCVKPDYKSPPHAGSTCEY